MASRLPQAIDGGAPNGVTTRGVAVDVSGLEQAFKVAGHELKQYDEARKAADDEIAARELETANTAYQAGALERASLYDGRGPGFASAELAAFDAQVAPLLARDDLDDGVRDSLTRQSRDLRVRIGSGAVATEARARGARAAADRDASEQAEAYRAIMAFDQVFDGLEDARRKEWDGATPGFAEGLRADFAFAREQVTAGLSPAVAERVRNTLMSREVTLQATAMAQEDEARDAGVMRTVTDGVASLGNRAARDPSLLARWDEEFAPIRTLLPAHLRVAAEREAKQDVFSRGLSARIEAGDFDAVRQEIAAGRYDWMDPGVVERLGAAIETADAVRTVEDAMAEADLAAEIDRDLTGILEGRVADAGLAARAEAVGGPDLAAKVRTDQQAALRVRPLMARLRTMTPAEVSAELERLSGGSVDAVGARTLELAQAMVAQNQELKGGDPATWTMTSVGPGDRVAENVQRRLAAFESAPSAETALAYAAATWNAQRAGGIGFEQRRILPASTAEAWVAAIDADGAPAAALPDLREKVALFGEVFRPQIVRELGLAGLSPADLGALSHYNTPVQMDRYVRARAAMETGNSPGGRRTSAAGLVQDVTKRAEVEEAVNQALAPYHAAFNDSQGTTARRDAALVVAYSEVARGASVRDAARLATAPITEGWDYRGTYAIPTTRGLNVRLIAANTGWAAQELFEDAGRGLYAPPPPAGLTRDQSRRNYLDVVRERGQWRNLPDGSGVYLIAPGRDGWHPVRRANGQDVVMTWEQLNRSRVRRDGRWVLE